ncbi:sugar ABC transporter substrate-binding protein [Paraburkholderia guartelaensis]|uniref:Sugar ABC transporter substrate-binding protein n=1 Tax=Paraburkholderia guartelaensis TaxID=2546446 RepID=A0A4R5LLS8_9BURK|nr:sugar ABC transporter substrate-binding protein [Paraburkholderia guartelaensis]TDG10811.1 sugar ABC transporter substrate-binding protein [Paraburkholderia guartelaensis]
MKKLLAASAAIGLAFSLSCTSLHAATLSVWAVDEPDDYTAKMAQEFGKLHPDVHVQIRKVGFAALNDETMRAVMSGNMPDVVPIDNPNTAMFASKNALLDLDPYLAKSKVIDAKQIFPGPLKNATWNGKVYAIPRGTNTLALYYNKDMFKAAGLDPEHAPQTWDELYTDAQKLTDAKKGVYGLAFSAINTEEGVFQFLPFVQAAGADWDRMSDPGAVRAAAFWQKLLDSKVASQDTLTHSQSEAAATFINGNAAMDIDGPWELGAVEKGAKFKWGVALLPVEKAGGPRASALGEQNHAILRGAKNPDVAFQFLEYMYAQRGRDWNEFGMLPPSRDTVTPNPKWPQAYKVFNEQMQYARPRGPNPNWPKISKSISDAIQSVLTHQATPQQAMAADAQTVQAAAK